MKKLKFKHRFLIYVGILILLMVINLLALRKVLVKYEKTQSYNTVAEFCNRLEKTLTFNSLDSISDIVDDSKFSRFEDKKTVEEQYIAFFTGKKAEYTLSSTSFDANHPVFIIHNGTEIFGELTLKVVSEHSKLGMLTITEWGIESFKPETASFGTSYAITAPEEFVVKVNGTTLGKDDISTKKNGEVLYLVKGFTKEPQIVIEDANGTAAKYTSEKAAESANLVTVVTEYELFAFKLPSSFTVETELKLRKTTAGDYTNYTIALLDMLSTDQANELIKVKDMAGDEMLFSDQEGVPAPAFYAYSIECPFEFSIELDGKKIEITEANKLDTAITDKQYSKISALAQVNVYTVNSILTEGEDSASRLVIKDSHDIEVDYTAKDGKINTVVADLIITLPDNFTLVSLGGEKVNLTPVESDIAAYEELYKYTSAPKANTYTVANQYGPVEIVYSDNLGQETTTFASGKFEMLEQAGSEKIYNENVNYSEEMAALLKKIAKDVDPVLYGKQWSLFMTTDLSGETKGYYTLRKYIVNGSVLDKYAYKWATGVDSNFIGNHVFDNPPFKEESYTNFVLLNEKAFYCDVYFIKSFTVTSNKTHHDDQFKQRLYFILIDDNNSGTESWQVVDMKELVD